MKNDEDQPIAAKVEENDAETKNEQEKNPEEPNTSEP